MGEAINLRDCRGNVFRPEPLLAGFTGHIDFEQDGLVLAGVRGPFFKFTGQLETIDGLDQLEVSHGFARFVALQVPNEMPVGPSRYQRDLSTGFLKFVFAESG